MNNSELKNLIRKSVKNQNEEWKSTDYGLLTFFSNFPDNSHKRYVIPKLVAIDHIYKGSLYRQGLTKYSKEIYSIADAIISNGNGIDKLYLSIKRKRKYDRAYKDDCVALFNSITGNLKRSNRQVFLSKYLHFHLPLFFPILDQYAESKIIKLNNNMGFCEKSALRGLSRYEKFYSLIEKLYFFLDEEFTFKELDLFLYGNREEA